MKTGRKKKGPCMSATLLEKKHNRVETDKNSHDAVPVLAAIIALVVNPL